MLIGDLEYYKRRSNVFDTVSGHDCPENCNLGPTWWHNYPYQDFNYQFNSWGFRGPDYNKYIGRKVNLCLGDSFTVNVGGPIEHSWASQLAKRFDIPTLNLGMDGAGNDAIRLVYDRACKIFDVQNTFVMYSFLHRIMNSKIFEFAVLSESDTVKKFMQVRICEAIEAAIPRQHLSDSEFDFLNSLEIFIFNYKNEPAQCYAKNKDIVDLKRELYTCEESYNNLSSNEWPSFAQFINNAQLHNNMLDKNYSNFLLNHVFYVNRDGYHMNQKANKIYADYFYNQWKQRNES